MTLRKTPTAEAFTRDDQELLPGKKLLDGLSRYRETVFLAELGGRVLWSSNDMNGSELFVDHKRGRVSTEPSFSTPTLSPLKVILRDDDLLGEKNSCNESSVNSSSDSSYDSCYDSRYDVGVISHLGNGGKSLLVAVAREENVTSLRESTRATLSAVLGTAPDAVLAIDPRGRISFANAAAENVLGWASKRIVGVPVATLIADTEGLECVFGCLQGNEPLRDRNLVFRDSDGTHRNVAASSGVLGSDLCAEPHTLLYLRDVSERIRNEAELIRTNEELEHCINALSHDLRSPLVALLGFSRLLRQDYAEELDETARHYIERIEQAGETMNSLVHDLLELSQVGQHKEPRNLVDPLSVLHQLKAELKAQLDVADIELVLPDGESPLVFCDRTRLYQVFSNLIGNAIDHAGLGNGEKIWVEIRDMGFVHRIAVRDRGRGISRESHKCIFEAFQSLKRDQNRSRNQTKQGHGTGIGLAIVKKIAETHGGQAWVESETGRGSTFYVTFPKAHFDS